MLAPSKYDSATNPLGTQKLQRTYLIAADNIVIEQLQANVILQQPDLDVSKLSPGLAAAINTFQNRIKNNARFVLNKVVPDFRQTLSDVALLGNVIDNSFSVGFDHIKNAYQDADAASKASAIASHIANMAGEKRMNVDTLIDDYAVANQNIKQYVDSYRTKIAEAIALLSDSAKEASAEIDNLQASITQNIKDIVEGGDEVGGAITKLGTGILSKLSGAGNDPVSKLTNGSGGDKDKDKKDEEEEEDDEDDEEEEEDEDGEEEEEDDEEEDKPKAGKPKPDGTPSSDATNVDFAVEAIHASQEGMAKASQAAQELTLNNNRLAAAYQKLAQENVLMAIAKVMQVQNQLFLDGLMHLEADANGLRTEWTAVESAYSDFGQQVKHVSESEAGNMSSGAQAARALWKNLGNQLTYVASAMAGVQ